MATVHDSSSSATSQHGTDVESGTASDGDWFQLIAPRLSGSPSPPPRTGPLSRDNLVAFLYKAGTSIAPTDFDRALSSPSATLSAYDSFETFRRRASDYEATLR